MTEKTQLDRIEAKLDQLLAKGATRSTSSGANFPNYGRAKGQPIHGASLNDLRFYESGCVKSLGNPEKARFHAQEQKTLDAIRSELRRQGHAANHDENGPPPDDAF